jgi:hypothetical protein
MGEWRYCATRSYAGHQTEMGGQVRGTAALRLLEARPFPLNRRLPGLHSPSGSCREEVNLLLLLGIEPRLFRRQAYSVVTVPTTPSLLFHHQSG